jgi:hypothetical protein
MRRHRRDRACRDEALHRGRCVAFIAGASSALNDMDFQRRSRNDSTPKFGDGPAPACPAAPDERKNRWWLIPQGASGSRSSPARPWKASRRPAPQTWRLTCPRPKDPSWARRGAALLQHHPDHVRRLRLHSRGTGREQDLPGVEGGFQGSPVSGATILSDSDSGLIREIQLYHRPYGQVRAFAAELAQCLAQP